MASKATTSKQAGATPGKLALIGVLAVVLGVVLYLQFGNSNPKSIATAVQPVETAPRVKSAKSATSEPAPSVSTAISRNKLGPRASWQSPELASVVQYDPFALPASFPQPRQADVEGALAESEAQQTLDASAQQAALDAERSQSESALASLRQQGVQAIIEKGDQYVAIIGDQEIHVGDEFQGFKVIAIDANKVHLAKDLSP